MDYYQLKIFSEMPGKKLCCGMCSGTKNWTGAGPKINILRWGLQWQAFKILSRGEAQLMEAYIPL